MSSLVAMLSIKIKDVRELSSLNILVKMNGFYQKEWLPLKGMVSTVGNSFN